MFTKEFYKMEMVEVFSPIFENEVENVIFYLTRKTVFSGDNIMVIEVFELVSDMFLLRDSYELEKGKELRELGNLVNDWQEVNNATVEELLKLKTPKI